MGVLLNSRSIANQRRNVANVTVFHLICTSARQCEGHAGVNVASLPGLERGGWGSWYMHTNCACIYTSECNLNQATS